MENLTPIKVKEVTLLNFRILLNERRLYCKSSRSTFVHFKPDKMKIVSSSLSLINNYNCFTFNQILTSWEKWDGLAERRCNYFNRLVVLHAFSLNSIKTSEKSESN